MNQEEASRSTEPVGDEATASDGATTLGRRLALLERAGMVLALALTLAYLGLAWTANTDLAASHRALFMDELITWDGASRLLDAKDSDILRHRLAHDDDRYGTVLFVTAAAVAALPRAMAGDEGQIVAVRMLHALLLLAAMWALVVVTTRRWALRGLGLLWLMAIPTVGYYSTMPKPEPYVLLGLAFFIGELLRDGATRRRGWVALGFALGAKIAVLPAFLVFVGWAVLQAARSPSRKAARRLGGVALALFVGFTLAEPALLYALIDQDLEPLTRYLRSTLLNTGHGADDSSVGVLTWLRFVLSEVSAAPAGLVTLGAAAWVAWLASRSWPALRAPSTWFTTARPTLCFGVTVAGAGLLAAIFVAAHRLWDFYLHPGLFLLVGASLAFLDDRVGQGPLARSPTDLALAGWAVLATFLAIGWQLPDHASAQLAHGHRTASARHQQLAETSAVVADLLNRLDGVVDEQMFARVDRLLFRQRRDRDVRATRIWGPFVEWGRGPHVVAVLTERLVGSLPPETVRAYAPSVKAAALRQAHVGTVGAPPAAEPWYEPWPTERPDIAIFVRHDVAERFRYAAGRTDHERP